VQGDEDAILGHPQIRLNEVRTMLKSQTLGSEGVLRAFTAGAAMSQDPRLFRARRGRRCGGLGDESEAQ
jgi:hypothetical protein